MSDQTNSQKRSIRVAVIGGLVCLAAILLYAFSTSRASDAIAVLLGIIGLATNYVGLYQLNTRKTVPTLCATLSALTLLVGGLFLVKYQFEEAMGNAVSDIVNAGGQFFGMPDGTFPGLNRSGAMGNVNDQMLLYIILLAAAANIHASVVTAEKQKASNADEQKGDNQ